MGISITIGSEEIESEYQVKLAGVLIDNKLSYQEYISSCLHKASAKCHSTKNISTRSNLKDFSKNKFNIINTQYYHGDGSKESDLSFATIRYLNKNDNIKKMLANTLQCLLW